MRLFLREGSALLMGRIVSLVVNVGGAPTLSSPLHSLVQASAGWGAGPSWPLGGLALPRNRHGLAASVHIRLWPRCHCMLLLAVHLLAPCLRATLGSLMPPAWEFQHQFLSQQCQDLISQTSSPLSQNDSCTGRSADLLLPSVDTSRRRHDSLHDPGTTSRAEHFRVQVTGGAESAGAIGVRRQCHLLSLPLPRAR